MQGTDLLRHPCLSILDCYFQVKTIDFDVNFLNFEDPEVFARLTGAEYEKYWKESYGLDTVWKVDLVKSVGNVKTWDLDESSVNRFCAESESR